MGLCAATLVLTIVGCRLTQGMRRIVDLTEGSRASLAPAVEHAIRALPRPLALDLYFDADDARRRELETDALARLRIARPDLIVRTPLDDRDAPSEGDREEGYGRIVVHVGDAVHETTSTKDLAATILETAGHAPVDDARPDYPGYPVVLDGARRKAAVALAYGGLPLALLATGFWVTRSPRRVT
jgi:hypothetical protein